MSEQAPETHDTPRDPEVSETPAQGPEEQSQGSEEFKSEESKKAVLADLMSERDARKKLQEQVDKFEQAEAEAKKAQMSEIERAQAEVKEAQEAAEHANAELLKYRIAGKHKITDEEDIELFLTGTDEETLTRQAERLASRASGPRNPQPDPSAGPKGDPALTETEKAAAAEKAGDAHAAATLKAQQLGKLAQNL